MPIVLDAVKGIFVFEANGLIRAYLEPLNNGHIGFYGISAAGEGHFAVIIEIEHTPSPIIGAEKNGDRIGIRIIMSICSVVNIFFERNIIITDEVMNYLEHILSADRILIPLIKLNKIIFIGIAQQIQRTEIDGRTRLDLIALLIRAVIVLRKDVQISMYTLRFLIEHANVEIRKFNSRYELIQVRNSLGIRVIDHDRADDVRDTTSLSGGETFIVSLGLALGLSALSSRNLSFGNLFIDEGFGTLDPDTLSTVIDALAMLQSSQGKKVGVISHTDTMSERITTQIRIVKNGNTGSSHIEIYPQ